MGGQEAVDLAGMHPTKQTRIVGPVDSPIRHGALDAAVDRSHQIDGLVRFGTRAVGGLSQKRRCSLQPTERIMFVVAVFCHTPHSDRMECLEEKCSDATDEHRGVSMHGAHRTVCCDWIRVVKIPGGDRRGGALSDDKFAHSGRNFLANKVGGHAPKVWPHGTRRAV